MNTRQLLHVLAVSAVATVALLRSADARHQDAESWAASLAKAKAAYESASSQIHNDIQKAFDDKQRGASQGKSVDRATAEVNRLEAERKTFETIGRWPASIGTIELRQRSTAVRDALAQVYEDAGHAAIGRHDLSEMNAIAHELAAFKRVTDYAAWQSLLPLADSDWRSIGEALISPPKADGTAPPSALSVPQDAIGGTTQYAIELVVRLESEAGGFSVRVLDSALEPFEYRVSKAEYDAAAAASLFGRPGARFLLVVQEADAEQEPYVRIEAEGRRLSQRPGNLNAANPNVDAPPVEPWLMIKPDMGTRLHVEALSWKPLLSTQESGQASAREPPGSDAQPKDAGAARPKATSKGNRGGRRAQEAVLAALMWLQRHQSPDGRWNADEFVENCAKEKDQCTGVGSSVHDVGMTGLALLCFLGAREAYEGAQFDETVKKGLNFLMSVQDADGCLGSRTGSQFLYNHACASLAMIDAYRAMQEESFRESAQRSIAFILMARNPHSGWRYSFPADGDKDTSVTGWMTTVLEKGRRAGLDIDQRVLEDDDQPALDGALNWIEEMTDPNTGRTGYTMRGAMSARTTAKMAEFPPEKVESMTAVGILTRIAAGRTPESDPMIGKGVNLLIRLLPEWDSKAGTIDYYYWHYGTRAMFRVGGQPWERWDKAVQDAILDHQCVDKAECAYGSWDPIDPWALEGGRIYATALNCLTMQVYYTEKKR